MSATVAPILPDPVFMMSLYNERVRTGKERLHPWQIEVLMRFALPDSQFDYKNLVNRMNLVAANGSGKSAKCVAPAAVWQAMAFPNSTGVITSSSGGQLDRQTGAAIRHVCEQVNRLHGREMWTLKYREYTYRPDPSADHVSKIYMYATDEAGKAEGYHPANSEGRFAYFVDEAKSVSDDIFKAVERCNGKSHWMNVSSPGAPLGFFYNAYCSSRWWNKKVTVYDCPHIKQDEVESAIEQFGENSPLFRSAYLAEFTSVNESVVIPFERILRQYREPAGLINDGVRRAGVDLSAGGDEQVVVIMDGNQMIGMEVFCLSDHRVITRKLVDIFRKWNLAGENINVDDGYTGRAVIDYLRDDKFEVVPVQFGGSAYNKTAYGNRGTEMWMNFERHLQYLRLFDDPVLRKQLASRYYKRSDATGKIILESKREARANGHGSPDRADAAVLALARIPLGYFSGAPRFEASQPSDEEVASQLISKIASDPTIRLTEDQIIQVTLQYRSLREARRSALPDKQNSAEPRRTKYDCTGMLASADKFGGSEEDQSTKLKYYGLSND
jgi:hypothetical protein